MLVTKTARQKLRNYTRYIDNTFTVYQDALEYINKVVYREWPAIKTLPSSKHRVNYPPPP